MKKIIWILCLCSFFIYGCDNKTKISISTPEKDAEEMVVYHKQFLKDEISAEEFEYILNTKVNMYIEQGRGRDEAMRFMNLAKEAMQNVELN